MRNPTHTQALARILELTVLLSEDMSDGLGAHGLTSSRAQVVWELRRLGPSTQRALADVIDVTPRNITGLVDSLVATGFVTREPHPTDRRATLVTLTAHGISVTDDLQRDHDEFARQLFEGMSAEHLNGLYAGLGDVIATIRSLTAGQAQVRDSSAAPQRS